MIQLDPFPTIKINFPTVKKRPILLYYDKINYTFKLLELIKWPFKIELYVNQNSYSINYSNN